MARVKDLADEVASIEVGERELNKARAAVQLPWSAAEANDWAERFPRLALVLPAEEAKELTDAFSAELARLGLGATSDGGPA